VRQLKYFERHHIELIEMHKVSQKIADFRFQIEDLTFTPYRLDSCKHSTKIPKPYSIKLLFSHMVTYGFVHLLLEILNI